MAKNGYSQTAIDIISLICVLSLITITGAGCVGGGKTSIPSVQPPAEGKGIFKLTVDWSKIDTPVTKSKSVMKSSTPYDRDTPTHVVARLIYPPSSTYVEMTERASASTEGIITMQVPAGTAILQVAVFQCDAVPDPHSAKRGTAIAGTVREGIVIEDGGVLTIHLSDLDLERFDVEWAEPWKTKFADNNTTTVTEDDIISKFSNGWEIVEPTILINNPIWSDNIPENLRIDPIAGDFYYKKSDGSWYHDSYGYSRGTAIPAGMGHFDVKDDHSCLIDEDREERLEIRGWLGPYLEGQDWNLPKGKYYLVGAPMYTDGAILAPTEFILKWEAPSGT